MSTQSIYEYPDIYDIIMRASTDQLEAEVGTVASILRDRGFTRVLEIACGTSPHGILLAQRNISVTGLDLSGPMLKKAGQSAEQAGVALELVQADYTNFTLDTAPFDCAIFMSETFPLITEYEDLKSHFQCVYRHLRPGGIYLIDIDVHDRAYGTRRKIWGQRTVTLADGLVDVWYEDHPADWVRGINRLSMHCRIETESVETITVDNWEIRFYSPWTLSVLIQSLEGWRLKGFYSWHDLSEDIEDLDNYFMMLEKI